MADEITKTVLSVYATVSERVKDLAIKNGQLIFIQDKNRIAFDFGGKRVFYNQIEELKTDEERLVLEAENGIYYFVIDTAILWTYQDKWIQITSPPEKILFVGIELPELGSANKLYINRNKRNISVWNDDTNEYVVVGEANDTISTSDIEVLFL